MSALLAFIIEDDQDLSTILQMRWKPLGIKSSRSKMAWKHDNG